MMMLLPCAAVVAIASAAAAPAAAASPVATAPVAAAPVAAAPAAASGCDPTCESCRNMVTVTAEPCNTSSPHQRGWSLGAASSAGLRQVHLGTQCVGWDTVMKSLQLQPCATHNGDSWVNSTRFDCQQWRTEGGTFRAPLCLSNEHALNGCLDIHGKVGPGMQLTRCYGQPNDNFTITSTGTWQSEDRPPTFPQRCLQYQTTPCPCAGCCTVCAAGRHFTADGFCASAAPLPPKKVNIFLAVDTNTTAIDTVISELLKNRAAFTGITYQYFAICGEGSKDCKPEAAVGLPHLAPGHCGCAPIDASAMSASGLRSLHGNCDCPPDIAERFRAAFGPELELVPVISYGDTNSTVLLNQLLTDSGGTAKAFRKEALAYAKQHNLTGFNYDLEPTTTTTRTWQANARPFMAQFSAAMREAGRSTGWDSNGYEGFPLDIDRWIDMTTYYNSYSGHGFDDNMRKSIFSVGPERYALGYCPSCQLLNESEVATRFEALHSAPGSFVRTLDLWAVYGNGGDGVPPGWELFWPKLEAWLATENSNHD